VLSWTRSPVVPLARSLCPQLRGSGGSVLPAPLVVLCTLFPAGGGAMVFFFFGQRISRENFRISGHYRSFSPFGSSPTIDFASENLWTAWRTRSGKTRAGRDGGPGLRSGGMRGPGTRGRENRRVVMSGEGDGVPGRRAGRGAGAPLGPMASCRCSRGRPEGRASNRDDQRTIFVRCFL